MAEQPVSYYSELTVEGSLTALGTTRDGLQEAEAGRRLQLDGPNKLPKIARRPWYLKLAQNFIHLFALLLWVGAILAWLAGLPELSWAVIIVIVVNGFFSYWQEYQAERAADALEALLPRQVMFSNRLLLWGIAAELCVMMILIYFPPVARIFNMSPLGAKEWLLIVSFGIVLLLLEEGRKFIARQTHFGRPHDVGPVATEVTV